MAYLFWFLFGGLGGQKFYLGNARAGSMYALLFLGAGRSFSPEESDSPASPANGPGVSIKMARALMLTAC